jgi:dienelactone hydrolase
MAEVLLFHHAQGLTEGVVAFADELRGAGHVVHTPDLFEGKTFSILDEGIAHFEELGFRTILERGREAAQGLPDGLVYAGFSLGVLPAQMLAQTRPGAKAALLFSAAIPMGEFRDEWPQGVPLQIHTMADDELGDVPDARELVAAVPGAELFLYPGGGHLFADTSLPSYDDEAATLAKQRVLSLLGTL